MLIHPHQMETLLARSMPITRISIKDPPYRYNTIPLAFGKIKRRTISLTSGSPMFGFV